MPSMDLSDQKTSSGEERSCSICNTTKTPLWRGGPSGPKSLCNACGIKYRKKRREALGLESGGVKKENKKRDEESGVVERKNKSSKGVSLKLKMVGLGGEVVINKKKRKVMMKMGEEERAAILLMALSSGCVHG
ncbi:GATA transcription factor 15 [Rhynchospora pubera]|uniref:GATA transcription factor 15 n=1 Tax=Rhynchospora pubera TaxID=906938 RepID=A0AAV8HXR7_9POAL|nr:GATA transcription factor 15 [Rhynchospora pubera]KAJ4768111.1 GATA transcription factor 15 [Rhynchospora pubera]KAJ4820815.1 GATA transcription factor 15 [Rhynchospora pubera]